MLFRRDCTVLNEARRLEAEQRPDVNLTYLNRDAQMSGRVSEQKVLTIIISQLIWETVFSSTPWMVEREKLAMERGESGACKARGH